MKVRMKADISGTRNGKDWPRRGEIIDLPDDEAVNMLNAGMVEPLRPKAGGEADVELAIDPPLDNVDIPGGGPIDPPPHGKARGRSRSNSDADAGSEPEGV